MIVLYGEYIGSDRCMNTLIVGVTATIGEAQALCRAYAQRRVKGDHWEDWRLYWIEVAETPPIEFVRELLHDAIFDDDVRPHGDDETPEEKAIRMAGVAEAEFKKGIGTWRSIIIGGTAYWVKSIEQETQLRAYLGSVA